MSRGKNARLGDPPKKPTGRDEEEHYAASMAKFTARRGPDPRRAPKMGRPLHEVMVAAEPEDALRRDLRRYTMTTADAAVSLGVHESAVRQARQGGRISAVKLGPLWYFDPREVALYRPGPQGPKTRRRTARARKVAGKSAAVRGLQTILNGLGDEVAGYARVLLEHDFNRSPKRASVHDVAQAALHQAIDAYAAVSGGGFSITTASRAVASATKRRVALIQVAARATLLLALDEQRAVDAALRVTR